MWLNGGQQDSDNNATPEAVVFIVKRKLCVALVFEGFCHIKSCNHHSMAWSH